MKSQIIYVKAHCYYLYKATFTYIIPIFLDNLGLLLESI